MSERTTRNYWRIRSTWVGVTGACEAKITTTGVTIDGGGKAELKPEDC